VASDLGLTAQVSGLDQNFGPQVQMNESDLTFLRRLLARVDADLHVIGRELHAAPRQSIRRGEVELILGDTLKNARILADFAHQTTKATARGWDVSSGSAVEAEGQENALGPGTGEKGGPLLERTLGARPHHTGHLALATQEEADVLAGTVRNVRARRFLRITGEAEGDPRLRAGSHARVSGVGKWFTNTFFVTSARHLYDRADGYRVEFEGECAFLGRPGA
jgi:phage protein D